MNWITVAGIAKGPVFRKLDRWGHLAEDGLNANSLIPLLRRVFSRAGVPGELYTSHSLRRGFATWATANGWDVKALMTYVGWKDMKSAMRYIDTADSFGELAVANCGVAGTCPVSTQPVHGAPRTRPSRFSGRALCRRIQPPGRLFELTAMPDQEPSKGLRRGCTATPSMPIANAKRCPFGKRRT
ncbi:tyrosine-type recombinase/integrase [Pseudomonas sp. CVAP|uniref:tyrosine-type recombinase/integrase n=1 Tax=Pseudomonas sp. CVAP\